MIAAIKQQADVWVHAYGDLLRSQAIGILRALQDRIAALSERLTAPTETLEQLQAVLSTVVEIQDANMDMELAFADVQEQFRTLRVSVPGARRSSRVLGFPGDSQNAPLRRVVSGRQVYRIEIKEHDAEAADNIAERWRQMVFLARSTDQSLLRVKQRFMRVAQSDVAAFSATTDDVRRRLAQEVWHRCADRCRP